MEQLLSSAKGKMFMWHLVLWAVIGCVVGYAASWFAGASAGGSAAAISMINSGDTAWMLASSALVMIMTPAVGFFYGGMVSYKNVVSVIKQSMIVLALISVQWVVIGYSLAFGPDAGGHGLIGTLAYFGLRGVGYAPDPSYAATIPALVYMIFQAMFAIVTPALIIGAFVERIKFKTMVVFTLLWATLVYDPVAHWVWSPMGWLHTLGALDFAGGTVVHMTAGFSALAAAMLVGKRLESGTPAANNIPFVILGAALLWFGWFGFNAGSALAAGTLAASAFVVTNTAAAAASLTWVALSWAQNGKPSAMAAAIGAVCGLVAITPASGFVGPIASIAIGVLGGVATYAAVYLRGKKIRIDDTLDVWAGHGIGGLTGALLTGVFAETAINSAGNNGLLFGNPHQLWVQFIAVVAVGIYSFVATWIILKVVSGVFPLRVSSQDEAQGLDIATHGEPGYRF